MPVTTPIFNPKSDIPRQPKKEPIKHDGLCVIESGLSHCWCKCGKCWWRWGKCVCLHCPCRKVFP